MVERLVGVGQAAHARHDAEHVVVDGVDAHLGRALLLDRVDGQREVERGLVNAREVARAAGLVLLGLEREGVHVDAHRRRAGVVLPRLHLVEVAALALVEAVLAVELHLGNLHGVLALALDVGGEDDLGEQVVRGALEEVVRTRRAIRLVDARARRQTRTDRDTEASDLGLVVGEASDARTRASRGRERRDRRTRLTTNTNVGRQGAAAEHRRHDALRGPVVGVVERLLAQGLHDPRRRGGVAVNERVALDNPDQLLDGVVEVHLDLVGRGSDRLVARELELVNQVLVRLLGEAAALLRVEVDVVDVERRGHQLELGDSRDTVAELDRRRVQRQDREVASANVGVAAVVVLLELHVDAHLVVLEGDERDRQARVAAVPELQRDIQRLEGRARAGQARVCGLRGGARGVQRNTRRVLQQHEVGGVANHVVERHLGADGLRQLRPDLHPVTILAVNAGSADLDLDLLDQAVADVVEPAEAGALGASRVQVDLGQRDLDVCAVHQIGVAADDSRDAAAEVSLAVERHLNRLHGEVGVALVEHLPEGNLGITRDIDILGTVRDELH